MENCECRGPTLRSYAHRAHEANRADSLSAPSPRAIELTGNQANLYRAAGGKIYEYYRVAGNRGGLSRRSTLHTAKRFYAVTTAERLCRLAADFGMRWKRHATKQHTKNLAKLKQFSPNFRMDRWSGWKITATQEGAVQSPERFAQRVLEITMGTPRRQKTICFVEDDYGTFSRSTSLKTLQAELDREIPTRAYIEHFLRQGDIYVFPATFPLDALSMSGEIVEKRAIGWTRHLVSGYRVEADGRAYYAPETTLSAPDHPTLTLKTWGEIEQSRKGD